MKYIIFQCGPTYMPIIFPNHVTHSQVKIVGAVAISAGFFYKTSSGICTSGVSESLGLAPHSRDARLIDLALLNAGTSSFLTDQP
jgi:hypothetical protein